jgi:large subunit ribosomal protein L7/L12
MRGAAPKSVGAQTAAGEKPFLPMADIEELAEQLVGLTIKEANELANHLEEEYDIKPASAGVAVAAGDGAGGGGDAEEEEQTAFDVVLTGIGGNKIQVIKEVRSITGLGLKEAKSLVDEAPNPVKEGLSREEADEMKAQLEEAGAEIELQ